MQNTMEHGLKGEHNPTGEHNLTAEHNPKGPGSTERAPASFHHNSWVVSDHERTRQFYEGVLGIPLVSFWIERAKAQGEEFVFGHAFYSMKDGKCLSFFNFASPEHQERFKSPKTEQFNHIAMKVDAETQKRYQDSLTQAGYHNHVLEHGYCRSLYTIDPDGLRLEFAVDAPQHEQIVAEQLQTSHDALKSWMDGNRTSNNRWAPAGNRQG